MAPEPRSISTGSGEQRLTVEYVAARVLLDATSMEEAALGILQAICESLGWVGTLAIDIVDAKTKSIVWRGMASKDIDVNASPEKRERNINRTAEKLLKNYPPKK